LLLAVLLLLLLLLLLPAFMCIYFIIYQRSETSVLLERLQQSLKARSAGTIHARQYALNEQ
jgi:hypothetical protein